METLAQQISHQTKTAAAADPAFDLNQYRRDLTDAIDAEARRRLGAFFQGVEHYRKSEIGRDLADPPTVWQEGASRLLDYGNGDGAAQPILVVPSLINRGYILD